MKLQCFSMPNANEIDSLINFCKTMGESTFYRQMGTGGVMAIYLTAKEHNLPFMACLNGGLHTYNGKVTFSAIMIDALILKAGHTTEVLQLDERVCRIRFVRGDRKDDPNYKPFEFEYTIEKAQKAGYLSKDIWKKSPQDMLYCRCITGGGRKHIPEVFVGVLVTGELVGDDRDGQATILLPEAANQTILIEDENTPKEVEKIENYDELCVAREITEGSIKMKFIEECLSNSELSKVAFINKVLKNPEKFQISFDKWSKQRTFLLDVNHPQD